MFKKLKRLANNLFFTSDERKMLESLEEKLARGQNVPLVLIQSVQARMQSKRVNLFWLVILVSISILILVRQ